MKIATAPPSPVQAHLASCHQSADALAEVVERLRSRLACVLSPKPDGTPVRNGCEAQPSDATPRCDLASELSGVQNRVMAQVDELNSLLSDLQL